MKCQACVDFILRYLENDLSTEERESFEFHLDKCPPCRRYLDQYRFTVKAVTRRSDERQKVIDELRAFLSAHPNDTVEVTWRVVE